MTTGTDSSLDQRSVVSAIRPLEGWLLAAGAFYLLQLPFQRTLVDRGHGIVAFERASADTARQIVADWGVRGEEAARMQLLVDFAFLVTYVGAVLAACWFVTRCRPALSRFMSVPAVLAVVAGVLDVIENAVLFRILSGERLSSRDLATFKFVAIAFAVVFTIGAVLYTLRDADVRRAWRAANTRLPEPPPVVLEPVPKKTATTNEVAICCSGGGIRSASFNLGVLQVFMHRDRQIYQKAAVVSAVSGGSYIASALALTRHHSEDGALTDELPAFAPGSPEERRLRTHMHYLVPDKRTVGVGLLALLYGVTTNLGVVLVGAFVASCLLGWCLHTWAAPSGFATADPTLHLATWTWAVPLALVAVGWATYVLGEKTLPIYFGDDDSDQFSTRMKERIRSWALRLIAVAAVAATLVLIVPGVLLGLNRLALDNRPTVLVAQVISSVGLTTDRGCQAAAGQDYLNARDAGIRAANAKPKAEVPSAVTFEYGACGQTVSSRTEVTKPSPVPSLSRRYDETAEGGGRGLGATLLALLALIKTTAGRLSAGETQAKAAASGGTAGEAPAGQGAVRGALAAVPAVIRRTVAPWLGTVLVVALLLVFSLRVTEDAMLAGISFSRLLLVMVLATLLLLVLPFFTDANRTSLHVMYRERLSTVFAVRRTSAGTAEEIPYEKPLLWSELADDDGPELVVCATANVEEVGFVPPGRAGAPFVFSPTIVGVGATDPLLWSQTKAYEAMAGPGVLTVPAAVAISGAAVSPVMGRMTKRPVRLLLGVANVRLGVWLPNPTRVPWEPLTARRSLWQRAWDQWRAPGVRYVMREIAGRNSIRSRYVYVTDGGHYDNLGLVEALRRQPATVYVIDGSGDTPPTWTTLGHAISLARAELGAQIVLDSPPPTPKDGVVASNVLTGTITYANDTTGKLVVGKLVRTTTGSYDLDVYAHDDPAFPNKSTADQLYGDLEFESYRRFGNLTGELMAKVGHGDENAAEELPQLVRRLLDQFPTIDGVDGALMQIDLATDQRTLTFHLATD